MREHHNKSIEELDRELDKLRTQVIETTRKDYADHADDPTFDPIAMLFVLNTDGSLIIHALAGEPGALIKRAIEVHRANIYGYVLMAPSYFRVAEPGQDARMAERREGVMITVETHNRMQLYKATVSRHPTAMSDVEAQPFDDVGGRMVHLLR